MTCHTLPSLDITNSAFLVDNIRCCHLHVHCLQGIMLISFSPGLMRTQRWQVLYILPQPCWLTALKPALLHTVGQFCPSPAA
jgi:hypothetical protein